MSLKDIIVEMRRLAPEEVKRRYPSLSDSPSPPVATIDLSISIGGNTAKFSASLPLLIDERRPAPSIEAP